MLSAIEKTQIMSKKAIFIKNKTRDLRNVFGKDERWAPEHERLNMSPISAIDATEDFMNEKLRNRPIGSRKPPASVIKSNQHITPRSAPPAQQDQTWRQEIGPVAARGFPMQSQGRPHQEPERDYSQRDVAYEDVPEPPQEQFEHPHRALGVDISGVLPGQYCLVYANEVWPSDSIREIEDAIERIMRSDPSVQDEELIVIKRLNIKVGVSIDG